MIGAPVFYQRKKATHSGRLSLVSLMDIFTILVFFLLLNSGESERIENAKFVELPDSVSGLAPHTELQILISEGDILLGEVAVAEVDAVMNSPDRTIEALASLLTSNKEKLSDLSAYEKHTGLAVTISADKSVPYALLEKVMSTCQHTGYRNISLAVNRISGNVMPQAGADAQQAQLSTDLSGGI